MTTGARVKSADRTVELLELLAGSPGRRTLIDLARHLAIPKSSMHGLLHTLVQRGWVETDPTGSRYGLGVQALRTGAAYLRNDRSVRRMTPVVEALHTELGSAVRMGRLVGTHVVILVARDSGGGAAAGGSVEHRPAHRTALGLAVLARLLPLVCVPAPGDDPQQLAAELELVRRRGYAIDPASEEPRRSVAVALPVTLGPHDAIEVASLSAMRAGDAARAITAAIDAGLCGPANHSDSSY
jgi:DNA-binding IclR family transcriptional regulator